MQKLCIIILSTTIWKLYFQYIIIFINKQIFDKVALE